MQATVGPPLHNLIEPELTLSDVGALLGISDNSAMWIERSATRKLRDLLAHLQMNSLRDFLSAEIEVFDRSTLENEAEEECSYSPERGWWRLSAAKSINGGSESLRDAAVSYLLLRLMYGTSYSVPLLFRTGESFDQVGYIESMTRFGTDVLFRAGKLHGFVDRGSRELLRSIVIVENHTGVDEHGAFDLPLPQAVLVSLKPRRSE